MKIAAFLSILQATVAFALPSADRHDGVPTYVNSTVYSPPNSVSKPGILYGRQVELPNGDLLATWSQFISSNETGYFPIYRSTDYGRTWHNWSRLYDHQGFDLWAQPFLYVLPVQIGKFPKNTLLASGNAVPKNRSSTNIDIYASSDNGKTFKFVSNVAVGGRPSTENGITPVWEPFLMEYKGKLITYYSDQRDPKHGQKLAHQTSTDLINWGPVVDDVAEPKYTDRPGMTTVARLGNGQYIITYEYAAQWTANSTDYSYPIYFKIANDPEKFQEVKGTRLVVNTGEKPNGGPYVTWTPYGGPDGTIIVDSSSFQTLLINKKNGKGVWTGVKCPAGTAYSRSLHIMNEDDTRLLVFGAGPFPDDNNPVKNNATATLLALERIPEFAAGADD
jgi:hypothetical protein